MSSKIWKSKEQKLEMKSILYHTSGGCCKGCHQHFLFDDLTIDHKHPIAKGGETVLENLQLLCKNCNQKKGAMNFGKWQKIKSISSRTKLRKILRGLRRKN